MEWIEKTSKINSQQIHMEIHTIYFTAWCLLALRTQSLNLDLSLNRGLGAGLGQITPG